MRFFLAGLLLVNIVFAVWYWLIKEPETVSLPKPMAGVETLVLASEQNPAEAVSWLNEVIQTEESPKERQEKEKIEKENKSKKTSKSIMKYCYATDKFDAREQAEKISFDLTSRGYQTSITTLYLLKPKYLVYLQSYPSLSEARYVTRHLKESGQKDYQILTVNGNKNSISLGVYSQIKTAKIRRREIEALGYKPIIEPAYGKISGYRVEFSKQDQSLMTEQDKVLLFKSYRNGSIESIKCGS